MRLDEELVASLDLKAIAAAAASRGNDFFPSTIAFRSATADTYLSWLSTSWKSERTPESPEYAIVPKFGGGTRLAVDLHVPERLLFDGLVAHIRSRSLVDLVHESVPPEVRDNIDESLAAGSHDYIVMTDVVGFYDYIDRERLINELVDISGAVEATSALGELLEVATAGRQGIPQGLMPTATFLGDVYLSIADRILARSGTPVVRWVDDYRLTATSLRDAYRVKTDLEVALRDLGLVIGSAKTYIVARKALAARIRARQKRDKELDAIRARIQKRVRDEYEAIQDHDQAESNPRRPTADVALEAGFNSATQDDAPTGAGEDAVAASRQIQLSLRELGRTGSEAPLKRLEHLLYRQPHSTKHVATYLRQRIQAGFERDTIAAISKVLADEDFPYPWQRGWLLHSLVPATTHLPKAAKDAAAKAFNSVGEMSFIRGRAAIVLATEGLLPMGNELGAAYETLTPASRPDVVVAATLMPPSPDQERFLASTRREPLNREVERQTLEAKDAFVL
jgi:hypothetical protein